MMISFKTMSLSLIIEQFVPAKDRLPRTLPDFFARGAKNQWVADGIPFAFIVRIRFKEKQFKGGTRWIRKI